MTRRNRVFIGILLLVLAGTGLVLYRVVIDLDPRYRESAEESLVETAHVLASLVEQDARGNKLDTQRLAAALKAATERRFDARIFGLRKTQVELRVRVTDHLGKVVYDSLGVAQGQDYSNWRDVKLALAGEYGARTTPDVPGENDSAVMYVAAPVRAIRSDSQAANGAVAGPAIIGADTNNAIIGADTNNAIIGVVSVGKPVRSFGQFVQAAREKTLLVGLLSVLTALLLAALVSVWLVLPVGLVTGYVRYVLTQRHWSLTRLGRRTLAVISTAYSEMRDTLAGRHYVSDYVQTLTHEVKSPLSAIRGAAELLQEGDMPASEKAKFLANILRETQRIQELVDRMMELTLLESRQVLDLPQPVALLPLLHELAGAAQAAAASRQVRIEVAAAQPVSVEGDVFLLRRAVSNLLGNAVDFSPAGGLVQISLRADARQVQIAVQDQGPGIADYAQGKLFEKFYSLARPHSGKKSTGLGLSFVREITDLHHGRIALGNRAEGGALATLTLPLQQP